MADPLPSPPSTPPPQDPKPPTPPAGKSPNKRKSPTVTGSPANKRPKRDIPPTTTTTTTTSTADIADTATGKQKVNEQDVDVDDIEVLQGLLDYHSINGVFPFENPADMKNFLRPWLILRFGNEEGWKTKIEQVKTKFTKENAPIEDGERKEFDLWMKIWGNDQGGDDDRGQSAAGS